MLSPTYDQLDDDKKWDKKMFYAEQLVVTTMEKVLDGVMLAVAGCWGLRAWHSRRRSPSGSCSSDWTRCVPRPHPAA